MFRVLITRIILVLIALICIPLPVFTETAGEQLRFKQDREKMVRHQIKKRGISDQRVISAMTEVPRHVFVPTSLRSKAYSDRPLPIGEGQTISQPYIVALMTESLSLTSKSRVLEIGTGSGYQAAVLAKITNNVYTIEIKEKLFKKATKVLRSHNFNTVKTRAGDGYYGWKAQAPFDAIMITAAVDHIPSPLLKQLKNGGKLILPLGNPFSYQNLALVTKRNGEFTVRQITGVLFVPMTGVALDSRN